MAFFEVKQLQYPGSQTTAANLAKRFDSVLLSAVCKTMAEWIQNDKKPGRSEVELIGTTANKEMLADIEKKMGEFSMAAVVVTRCWITVRKCGYKQMRDERFGLFVRDVLEAIERRQK